jgi:hypothetical protein
MVMQESFDPLTTGRSSLDTLPRTASAAIGRSPFDPDRSSSWQDAAAGRNALPTTVAMGRTRMSRNMKSLEAGAHVPQRSSRPFDAVVIALSSALLVIFGIVIGRFIVTTQAVAVVDHFDGEVASLRAEIVDLNRQIVQSQARCTALEESAEQYRRLAQQHQIRAETLAARQQAIRSTLASLSERRDACLEQVQQYVALDQPIPAPDVLRFAQAMFDVQIHTMDQLAANTTPYSTLTTVPGFPPAAAATSATASAGSLASSKSAPTLPSLPAPDASVAPHNSKSSARATYFAPPRQQRPVASSTFFAPRRDEQALSMPRPSGIRFHDTATRQETAVRR